MHIVRSADARRTETPNAVMTTYASPTLGHATRAVWHVAMAPGAAGPEHTMDTEQVWTTLDGAATVTVDGTDHPLSGGDTVVLPAGIARRFQADSQRGFSALVTGDAGAYASSPGRDPVVPPWIA